MNVNSKMIKAWKYNPFTKTLTLFFHNNTVYQYFKVPLILVNDLKKCQSVGEFINAYVKKKYEFKKIK